MLGTDYPEVILWPLSDLSAGSTPKFDQSLDEDLIKKKMHKPLTHPHSVWQKNFDSFKLQKT
jgi:hypothetical protein